MLNKYSQLEKICRLTSKYNYKLGWPSTLCFNPPTFTSVFNVPCFGLTNNCEICLPTPTWMAWNDTPPPLPHFTHKPFRTYARPQSWAYSKKNFCLAKDLISLLIIDGTLLQFRIITNNHKFKECTGNKFRANFVFLKKNLFHRAASLTKDLKVN